MPSGSMKISKKDMQKGKHRYNATFDLDDFLYLRAVALDRSTPENIWSVQKVLNDLIQKERKRWERKGIKFNENS